MAVTASRSEELARRVRRAVIVCVTLRSVPARRKARRPTRGTPALARIGSKPYPGRAIARLEFDRRRDARAILVGRVLRRGSRADSHASGVRRRTAGARRVVATGVGGGDRAASRGG